MDRILMFHRDIFVLAGDARAMYMFADMFKYLGYDILFLYTDIRPPQDWFFTREELKKYHPVKYIDFKPVRKVGKPPKEGIVEGDFQMVENCFASSRIYDYMIHDCAFDIFFTDQPEYMFWADDVDFLKEIYYIHFPYRPTGPERTMLWCNSTYIREVVKAYWGREPHVVHPPMWIDMYDPNNGFNDRDIDVVMFAQMYKMKGLDIAKIFASMGMTAAIMGADVGDYEIEDDGGIMVFKNVTFEQYTNILSRSKVYIHGKPSEHFGITVAEAMASGAVPVVPDGGGPFCDIIQRGKYGLFYSDIDQLINNVVRLVEERNTWEMLHNLAIEGVQRFDLPNIAETADSLLETLLNQNF